MRFVVYFLSRCTKPEEVIRLIISFIWFFMSDRMRKLHVWKLYIFMITRRVCWSWRPTQRVCSIALLSEYLDWIFSVLDEAFPKITIDLVCCSNLCSESSSCTKILHRYLSKTHLCHQMLWHSCMDFKYLTC